MLCIISIFHIGNLICGRSLVYIGNYRGFHIYPVILPILFGVMMVCFKIYIGGIDLW